MHRIRTYVYTAYVPKPFDMIQSVIGDCLEMQLKLEIVEIADLLMSSICFAADISVQSFPAFI